MLRRNRGASLLDFKLERAVTRHKIRQSSSFFDHVNLKNMYVMLNSTRYPAVDYNLSFANQQFSRAYGDASLFGIRYFSINELITRSNISPANYKKLYPLFVFDVSKQSEKLRSSVVDVQIRAIFNQAVPAGTQAYAVVMSDKLLTFQSDGSKMSVLRCNNAHQYFRCLI